MTVAPEVQPRLHTPRHRAETPLASPVVADERRRPGRASLHLFSYVVGNALAWALWGAVSISADHWYWWAVIPLAGWTLVLAIHLAHVFAPGSEMSGSRRRT
jgi:2TM domain-containing protein